MPLEYLDVVAAREALTEAQAEEQRASTSEAKAEARIAIETSEALIKACEGGN